MFKKPSSMLNYINYTIMRGVIFRLSRIAIDTCSVVALVVAEVVISSGAALIIYDV